MVNNLKEIIIMTTDDLIEAKTYFEVYRELPPGMAPKMFEFIATALEKEVTPVVIEKPKRKAATTE
jgi:hypothetical protein